MSTTQEAVEMSSGVEAKGQPANAAVESRVDWQTAFDEYGEGDYIPRENLRRHLVIKGHVDSESDARNAIQTAEDVGEITLKNKGYRIASGTTDTETPVPETETSETDPVSQDTNVGTTEDIHPTVQNLRDESEDTTEYVAGLESVVSDMLNRMDEIEEQVEDVQETDEDREERVNKVFTHYNEVRTGLTELQLRRLEDGELLSADAVDVDALDELGYDPIVVGDNRDAVRLPSDQQDDGDHENSRDLPDFTRLCPLEEARVKKKLKLSTRADIESDSVDKFRAMVVWDDAGLLNVSQSNDQISIPTGKVREKLMKIDDISEASSYQIAGRVMEQMTDETDKNWSDGVFRLDKKQKENRLVASVEDYTAATVQRFSTSSVSGEGGDSNTVVR